MTISVVCGASFPPPPPAPPHPLQSPGHASHPQLFIKKAIAIVANTFTSIWKPCSLEDTNDAAVISIPVGMEGQDVIFGEWSLREGGALLQAPQALQLPQPGYWRGLQRWGPLRIGFGAEGAQVSDRDFGRSHIPYPGFISSSTSCVLASAFYREYTCAPGGLGYHLK